MTLSVCIHTGSLRSQNTTGNTQLKTEAQHKKGWGQPLFYNQSLNIQETNDLSILHSHLSLLLAISSPASQSAKTLSKCRYGLWKSIKDTGRGVGDNEEGEQNIALSLSPPPSSPPTPDKWLPVLQQTLQAQPERMSDESAC